MDLLEVLAEYNVNVFKNFSFPTLSFLESDMLLATLISFCCFICVAIIRFETRKRSHEKDTHEKHTEDAHEKHTEDAHEKDTSEDKLSRDPSPEEIRSASREMLQEFADRSPTNFVMVYQELARRNK